MKSIINLFKAHKYGISTFLIGCIYFWFIVYSHDATAGDYQSFVNDPIKLSYGITRWFNWSSRLLIESSVNVFSKSLPLWKIVTVVLGGLLFWGIARIIGNKRIWHSVLLFSIMLLTNWYILSSAGIFATTINYLWPMACMVIVAALILKPFNVKILSIISRIIILPLFIYAVCSEQLAALSLILLIFYIIDKRYKKYSIPVIIWILLGISILGVINVVVSPGNSMRSLEELNSYWPGFNKLSIVQKMADGLLVTFSRLYLAPELLMTLLIFLLPLLAYKRKNLNAFILALPSSIITILFFFPSTYGTPATNIKSPNYFNEIRGMALNLSPSYMLSSDLKKIFLMLFAVITLSVLLSIFYLYGRSKKTVIILVLISSGFIVALAVALSPTLFASNTRTLYPLVIILTGIDFVFIEDLFEKTFIFKQQHSRRILQRQSIDE